MTEHQAFVMMTKEKYWLRFRERSQEGRKTHSFVLKGAAPPRNTKTIFFYVSNPVKALDGFAEFVERRLGIPEQIWQEFGNESVLQSKEEYDEFLGGTSQVSLIRFQNLRKAEHPIPLSNLKMLRDVKMLSRKGFYVDRNMAEKFISMME